MKKLIMPALIASFIALIACENSIVDVKTGPGTDYPCGVRGIQCVGDDGKVNHMCCGENETCGGKFYVGCPAGYCCFIGGQQETSWGAHQPHPQVPEHP